MRWGQFNVFCKRFVMLPQPILKISPRANVSFAPGRVIERPEVAAWIGQCITSWSDVETQTSRLFTLLFGTRNVEAGVELYNSFGTSALKQNAIKTLARSKLPRGCYEALLKVVESHQKTRDKIAHWYWGISDEIPDGLALVNPKNILVREARTTDKMARAERLIEVDCEAPRDEIYVYRIKDLKVDAKAFSELAALIRKCHGLCFKTGNRLWRLRDELLSDGRLAGRLNP
jgi:hypothetical protein